MDARSVLRWQSLGWLLVLLVVLWLPRVAKADTPTHVAFVIGNGDYLHADKLSNPIADARAMRDMLTRMGFDVIYGENLNKRDIERNIGRFAGEVKDAEVALVYYAGHGATFDDVSYVVPIDAQFTNLDQMPYELVPIETLIGELRRAKGVRIAILDACRDNSAERQLKRTAARGGEITRGLQRIKNPEGLILAYATQYLETAEDGPTSGNSPFTTALLRSMPTPGLDVKSLFFKVGNEVIEATKGRQRPEVSISFFGSFALVDSSDAADGTPQTAPDPQIAVTPPQVLPDPNPPSPAALEPGPLPVIADPNPPQPEPAQPVPEEKVARPDTTSDPAAEACDRLAAPPLSSKRPGAPGVDFEAIDAAAAVPACRKALAALPDDPRIMFELGRVLQKAGSDDEEALVLFRKAAEAGNADALNGIGTLYRAGKGVSRDEAEAVRWFRKAAAAGNSYAMDNLGLSLKSGKGVLPRNDTLAAKWFRQAAEAGNPNGMNNLGLMYEKGRGVPLDDAEAVRWFVKAAEAGNVHGMNNLGLRYKLGRGVTRNDQEAVRWFVKAAQRGNAVALNNLATMYETGRGVPKNDVQAIRLFLRAAAAGNSTAMSNIGLRLLAGRGVVRDEAAAATWFRKAAEANNADAMIYLGLMYRDGRGVRQDNTEALRLFRKVELLDSAVAASNTPVPGR